MLVGHGAVWHAVVGSHHLRRRGVLKQLLVALVLVGLGVVPGGRCAMRERDACVVLLVGF